MPVANWTDCKSLLDMWQMMLENDFCWKKMYLKLMLRNDVSKDHVDENGKKMSVDVCKNVRNYILGNHEYFSYLIDLNKLCKEPQNQC